MLTADDVVHLVALKPVYTVGGEMDSSFAAPMASSGAWGATT